MTDAGVISFELVERTVDHSDAVSLLSRFHQEQLGRYGFAESVDLPVVDYADPNGVFVVAYERELPIGCGGWRWFDRGSATIEIKKTYLVPAARGQGIGRSLLAWLEFAAAERGGARVVLETGVRNTSALSLFLDAGYKPIEGYVPGRDPAINRAFVKGLPSRS